MLPELDTFQNEVNVKLTWLDDEVLVRGYYEPAEQGSYDGNVQVEPDIAASFEVVSVYFRDNDIVDFLSEKAISAIAELACRNIAKHDQWPTFSE